MITFMQHFPNNSIVLLSNSVGIRIRPFVDGSKSYYSFLKDQFRSTKNFSHGARLSSYYVNRIDDVIAENGDIYILNIGVVDACSRELPYWLYKNLTSKSRSLYGIFKNFFYYNVIAKIRPGLAMARFYRPWINAKRFYRNIDFIVSSIQANVSCSIVIIGINIPDERVEKALPRSVNRVRCYNKILMDVASSRNCRFVDTSELSSSDYYPDGIHFNQDGHILLHRMIIESLGGEDILSL